MSKNLCLVLIALFLINGCSGGGRVTLINQVHQQTVKPDAVESVTAAQMNNGSLNLEVGLAHFKDLLAQASHSDHSPDAILPTGLKELTPGSAESLAAAFALIREGDFISNLSRVLGLVSATDSQETPKDVSEFLKAINSREIARHRAVVKKLNVVRRSEDEPAHQDAFLLAVVLHETTSKLYLNRDFQAYLALRIQNKMQEAAVAAAEKLPAQRPLACSLKGAVTLEASASKSQNVQDLAVPYFLQQYDLPDALVGSANQVLTEYSGLHDIFEALADNRKAEIAPRLFSSLYFAIHAADFRDTASDDESNAEEVAGRSHREPNSEILGGKGRALLLDFINQNLFDPYHPPTARMVRNASDDLSVILTTTAANKKYGDEIYLYLQKSLDAYAGLLTTSAAHLSFDQEVSCNENKVLARFVALSDSSYYQVFRPYQKWLKSFAQDATEGALLSDLWQLPEHPLTAVYFKRAMLELGWPGNLQTYKLHATQNPDFAVTLLESKKHFDEAWTSHRIFNQSNQVGITLSASMRDKLQVYVIEYQDVERIRYVLSENLNLFPMPPKDTSDARVQAYQSMRSHLEKALQLRYAELIANRAKLTGTADHASDCSVYSPGFAVGDTVQLCELNAELRSQLTDSVLDFRYHGGEGNLEMAPGIYQTSEATRLTVKSISFHPLSMILTQGKDFTLVTRTGIADSAWIDTSSPDAAGNQRNDGFPLVPVGTRPELTSQVCRLSENDGASTSDDFTDVAVFDPAIPELASALNCFNISNRGDEQGACLKLIERVHGSFHSGDYRSDEWKHCNRFSSSKRGSAPAWSAGARAPDGRLAGQLRFESSNTARIENGLLVSIGGDGHAGLIGPNSPQCKYVLPGVAMWLPESEDDPYLLAGCVRDGVRCRAPKTDEEKKLFNYDNARKNLWPRDFTAETRSLNPDFDVPSGPGGDGGNASNGGEIVLNQASPTTVFIIAAGVGGSGGAPAACGVVGKTVAAPRTGQAAEVGHVQIQGVKQ